MLNDPPPSSAAFTLESPERSAATLVGPKRPARRSGSTPPSIGGRYEIGEVLGEGGMGTVYAAHDAQTGDVVAIKVLRAELIGNPDAAARFEREAVHTSLLAGPRAVKVLDVGVAESGQPYMAMERLRGADLERILAEHGPLPIPQAVHYVVQACEAMKEPHARGIIHRDLKPSNLFSAITDDGLVLKVLDFGISRSQEESRLTRTMTSVGTPIYMSPEQARCDKDIDVRTDVWSLGVILYELVTGTVPFEGGSPTATALAVCSEEPKPPSRYRPGLPPPVEAVILRALAKDPAQRYASMDALADALKAAISEARADTLPGPIVRVSVDGATVDGATLKRPAPTPAFTPSKRRLGHLIGWAAALVAAGALLVAESSGAEAEASAAKLEPIRIRAFELRAAHAAAIAAPDAAGEAPGAKAPSAAAPRTGTANAGAAVAPGAASPRSDVSPSRGAAPAPAPALPSSRRPKFNER